MKLDTIVAVRKDKTIYRDGNHCIKLFNTDFSKADVLNEALNHARIEETGLNVPRLEEVTRIDGKWAIILQFIPGKTLEELMADVTAYENRVRQLEKVTMELTDRMKVLEKRANELLVEKEVLRKVSRASRMDRKNRPRNAVLYQFIREAVEACPEYANVKRLCEALNISASGYYAYCKS